MRSTVVIDFREDKTEVIDLRLMSSIEFIIKQLNDVDTLRSVDSTEWISLNKVHERSEACCPFKTVVKGFSVFDDVDELVV